MFDVNLSSQKDAAFYAEVGAILLGDTVVGRSSCVAQSFERSRYRTARDGLSHYLIQFYVDGRCGDRSWAESEWTRPGDLLVVDLAQPLMTGATDFTNLNLIVPRRLLAPLLVSPDAHHMRIIRSELPMVRILRSHVAELMTTGPQLMPAEGLALLQPTLHIVAAILNGEDARDLDEPGVNASLHMEIRRFIQADLSNPGLDAETVAARFGISRRKLYYLFEADGGFISYLRARRLEAIRSALIDPEQVGRSISDIANQFCFGNRSGLVTAFRRAYGLVPREARAFGQAGLTAHDSSPLHAAWRNWIQQSR
ncbi:helix-turn-helix domain-containing protein [Rhizobium sp. C4]|uniref:helix-turn-helix domain-containing protein n=1 Tax=Rhizobium sp. C4 TaxID=1349800 RepID=UPI001E3F4542|nr:helix-turn-helix domain-containing protein [Rhizobium sp. C4]MCD2173466.1 helix-turn-helix domain-containing protein [Rhizobium sp. C4]